jgi:multiple antibiotic resistance protein
MIMLEITEYTKFLVGLLAIVDPLGAIPVFIALTVHQNKEQRLKTARLTVVSVFFALMVALLFGEWILWAFGISVDAFRCAGGVFLLSRRHKMKPSHWCHSLCRYLLGRER